MYKRQVLESPLGAAATERVAAHLARGFGVAYGGSGGTAVSLGVRTHDHSGRCLAISQDGVACVSDLASRDEFEADQWASVFAGVYFVIHALVELQARTLSELAARSRAAAESLSHRSEEAVRAAEAVLQEREASRTLCGPRIHFTLAEYRTYHGRLREAYEIEPLSRSLDAAMAQLSEDVESSRDLGKVFLVHGHDHGVLHDVARFLEHLLGRDNIVVLGEKTHEGRSIIEKFEAHSRVGFAVVLLTPDDRGGPQGEPPRSLRPRARQNVVFELGYFLGAIGRDRVCALHTGDVEIPSNYSGVALHEYDPRGAWKLELARELKAKGFDVDLGGLL